LGEEEVAKGKNAITFLPKKILLWLTQKEMQLSLIHYNSLLHHTKMQHILQDTRPPTVNAVLLNKSLKEKTKT